jgi:hypothetical protein
MLIRLNKTESLAAATPFHFFRLTRDEKVPGPGLYLKPGASPQEFIVAASKRSNPAKITASPSVVKIGVPHLLVGRYNKTVTPHVLEIWINPAAESHGAANAPQATFTTADGADLPAAVNSLSIGGGNKCPGMMIDEIRVGNSWAEVVPKADTATAPATAPAN